METSGSERHSRPGEDHATEVAESSAGLGCCVLPVAKPEKLGSLRRAWASEACRAFSASDRHLQLHQRNDRHLVLVIDFSFDLENLYAHWLRAGPVTRIRACSTLLG